MAKFTDVVRNSLPTNTIDETGSHFGNLTVLKYVDDPRPGAFWLCRCDCGQELVADGSNLRRGNQKSCGHCQYKRGIREIDEVGNVYGELKVLERAPPPETVRQDAATAYWRCKCSCGNENFITKGQALRSGTVWHCGCLRHELLSNVKLGNTIRRDSLPEGLAGFNRLYRRYQGEAKKHDRAFELTKEDFSFLTKMNCFYCGDEPNQLRVTRGGHGDYEYSGLDRVDPSKGYTLDNVVPSCKVCNYMKKNYHLVPFLWHVSKIHNYRRL